MRQALAQQQEAREKSDRQYEVLQQSWKHLEESYKNSLARLRKQIEEIRNQRIQDRTALQKLELIIEQQRQELDKMRAAWTKANLTYEERLLVVETALKEVKLTAAKDYGDTEELREEAKRNADQLRHLLQVRIAFRDDVE